MSFVVCRAVFDENGRDNGSIFVVKYKANSLKMRCSHHTRTFRDVVKLAARYYGLPENMVFLSDQADGGCIYLNDMEVFKEIFPMKTAKRKSLNPILHIVLQKR